MKPWLKWTLGIVFVLMVSLFALFKWFQVKTKSYSPEAVVEYRDKGVDVRVFYNRPSKKGREIFGGLVPFGEVWRTGANECTTFDAATDVLIEGQKLPAGHYTLWTIPGEQSWKIIWNSKDYPWGVSWGGVATREAAYDVLTVEVPVESLPDVVELFTIRLENGQMKLQWDQTQVSAALTAP
jgi:hypothetical protein